MRIATVNLNGIRAALNKGLTSWLTKQALDICCFQELKADSDTLAKTYTPPEGFDWYSFSAQKKGYSGVGILSNITPVAVKRGLAHELFDAEGRALQLDFENWSIICVYLPSGTGGPERQAIKEQFLAFFKPYIQDLLIKQPNLIIAGDFNVAHTAQDIHDPVRLKNTSGFLPHERQWLTETLTLGLIDSYRYLHPNGKLYTWWNMRSNAYEKDKGWRIDYVLTGRSLADKLHSFTIDKQARLSDHAPCILEINI
jgi:exodeoxyribonuclease-3